LSAIYTVTSLLDFMLNGISIYCSWNW